MTDKLTKALEQIESDLPKARLNLSESEKDELIARIGPRLARDILKAKGEFSKRRIPFVFSSVDTQAIVDLLENDVGAAIERVLGAQRRQRSQ